MQVLVIGANGQVGKQVVQKLAESNHEVTAMVRVEEQMEAMNQLGADKVVHANLEGEFGHAMDNADAVIFAAGSGASTGADKTIIVDLWGAMKAIDYAKERGIKRFVQLSGAGTQDPDAQDQIKHYMIAKGVADRYLESTDLDYTIVRPTLLTNDNGAGQVAVSKTLSGNNVMEIPREDVAELLVKVLDQPNTYKKAFELTKGKTSIDDAVRSV